MNQKILTESGTMKLTDALACAADLKKYLLEHGIWFKYGEDHQGEIRFITIEASMRVKG